MTDQQHSTNSETAEFQAPEPSIPATHDGIRLTEDGVIIYDMGNSEQWIWADDSVERAAYR